MSEHAEAVEFLSADGFLVRGDYYRPRDITSPPVVVLCHGFKGYKQWGFFPFLASQLCQAGLGAVAIDFSHNGTFDSDRLLNRPASPPGSMGQQYVRPDLFAKNTLRREAEDLRSVVRSIAGGHADPIQKCPRLGLFGHSRGCIASIVNALESQSVGALCTWAATDDPDFYTERQKESWRTKGCYSFDNTSDGTTLSVGVEYLDDLEENHTTYHSAERVTDLKVPYLMIHGRNDLVVKLSRARTLHSSVSRDSAHELLELNTGHTFGVDDSGVDFESPPPALTEAAAATVRWFVKYLHGGYER